MKGDTRSVDCGSHELSAFRLWEVWFSELLHFRGTDGGMEELLQHLRPP